ncbi:cadherin EGF LAG seven-pass G-type receptor 2-like [Saccostrea echinata]|uniref:cadherin EGF LAG seven-pass G-type receptor 2-like n=1 Tax=Saccostrea echinata TaxID=191078 RepID=UPI002A80829F|nr:cadherin EGF LAG seven-pass G-type receptor 2-like [Saccostrea echinata]
MALSFFTRNSFEGESSTSKIIHMLNLDDLSVLFAIFLFNVHIHTVDSQEPCSSPDPYIAGSILESNFGSFDPNSALYTTDTTIEGINQGTQTASGVSITIVRSVATPVDLNLYSLFELVTLSVNNSSFGSRTFIRLKSAIDRDKDPNKTKFFLMQLEIRDINDNSPIFRDAPYSALVAESAPVGTTVFSGITATDRDAGINREIEYAIAPENNSIAPDEFSAVLGKYAQNYFYMDPESGIIFLKHSIEGIGIQQFIFKVTAADGGTPSMIGEATVTINVTNETLRFTQLQPYFASIDENYPVDRTFISVTATPQPDIKYSIIGFSDSPDYFKIDETTGAISIKTDLRTDCFKRTTYLILVRAEKQFPNGLQSVENTVNVTVARNINPPVFNATVYRASIDEKYNLGRSVVQVFATDLDTQDVLLYSIIEQTGETEPFYMAANTGIINLNQLLSGSSKTTYTFTVRVRDQSKPEKFGQSQVEITVRRNTSPPSFLRPQYGAGIDFNQAPGQVLTTSAVDPDMSGTLVYEVTGFFSAPGYFSVNSYGEINLIVNLASDTATSYTLGLSAYDSDYPNDKAYANVTITVNRNPNAPSFTSPSYSKTINESYPLAVSLVQINGWDADKHAIEYRLESSDPVEGTNFFYLNPATGLLIVSRPLTETITRAFTLQVRLRDNGIPPRSSTVAAPVTIKVTRNDHAPSFAGPFVTSIAETAAINVYVLIVTATDGDSNISPYGQLRYKLIGDGDFQQFFSINANNGYIKLQRSLTLQDVNSYQGRIVAEDGGSPARSATTIVTINIRRNLNPPVFSQRDYNVSVSQITPVGVNVIAVTATDADLNKPNNEIAYEMTDTTPNLNGAGLNFFGIRSEKNRGIIYIVLPLYTDNQDTPVYTFSVLALDQGNPQMVDRATVRIFVNRNLFPPVFQGTPCNATLNFNSTRGRKTPANEPHVIETEGTEGPANQRSGNPVNP